MAEYGSKTAPEYDMTNFPTALANIPILLFVGSNDVFGQDADFSKL